MFQTETSKLHFRSLIEALRLGPVSVFVGAGLSVPYQPTWRTLHAVLQREAGSVPPRKFEPEFAPADFADFRDALPRDRYLAILKEQFGGVVTDYPDLYRVLDEIQGVEQVVTTNYDEYVATVALSHNRRPRIAVYPSLGDLGARYVYLHGRAETASRPDDLVVTEDDYARAYDNPGFAKAVLQVQFARSVLFVGSSLQDPDLMTLLRQRSRMQIRGASGNEPELFAIVAVHPGDGESGADAFRAAAAVAESRLGRLGVRAICYARDRRHTQLRAILLQLQHEAERRPVEAVFRERVAQLNRLGALASPRARDVDRVRELIRGMPELARHFFRHSATSLAWYELLRDSVIVRGVQEPWDLGDGQRRIAPWAAAPYVQRVAAERPDAVVDLVQRLAQTRNWVAQSVLSRLVMRLPDGQLADTLPVVIRWATGPDAGMNRVADYLVELPGRLCERGESALARMVLAALVSVRRRGNDNREVQLAVDGYWLSELRPAARCLIDREPRAAYVLFRNSLLRVLAASDAGTRTNSRVWRPAIEDHAENFVAHREPLHYLLDWTRDALLAWANRRLQSAANEVARLLDADRALLRRLALHALTSVSILIAALPRPAVTEQLFRDPEHFHELALLVNRHCALLDNESQDLLHRMIRDGPERGLGTSDDYWQQYLDHHRWRWLAVLPDSCRTPEERDWWARLRTECGEPEQPFLLIWSVSAEKLERRDATVDETRLRQAWQEGGAPALAAALRGELGYWGPLVSLIKEDPLGLLALAPLLGRDDGNRLASYLGAYRDLTAEKSSSMPQFSWEPLIELMERLSVEDLSNATGVAHDMAWLIEDGVWSEHQRLPGSLLDRAFAIAVRLLDQLALPLDADPNETGRLHLHHLSNHAAGVPAMAAMNCIWQALALTAREAGGERTPPQGTVELLKDVVLRGRGGIEMRVAIGEFWFVLEWLDAAWFADHVAGLWLAGEDAREVNARRALLFGYLQSHLHARTWSGRVLAALRPMFQEGIRDLGRSQPIYFDEQQLREPFVSQLVIGYMNDVAGFGFDGLLGDFLAVAEDGERARFVRLLRSVYRALETGSGVDFEATKQKRDTFWSRRVQDLGGRLPVAEESQELSAFCSWAKESDESLSRLEERLTVSINHLARGREATSLLELIAARGQVEPLPAARLLQGLVNRLLAERDVFWGWHAEQIEAALDAICAGARPNHRARLRQIADRLLQADVLDYGDKLSRCGAR